jgi:hypothetical protein
MRALLGEERYGDCDEWHDFFAKKGRNQNFLAELVESCNYRATTWTFMEVVREHQRRCPRNFGTILNNMQYSFGPNFSSI